MAHILITGGAGSIGSSLAEALLTTCGHDVTVVDNLLTGSPENLPSHKKLTFIKADVNDFHEISSIMTNRHFDYVFHYAAVVGVERTLLHPRMVLDDITGIRNVLDLCKNTGVKRVFYSSSSEVYGEPVEIPQHEETTPLNARLPYAIVKNVGEAYCRTYQEEFNLPYTIFRFFNTYGPHQSEDFVVPIFLEKALAGKDIPVIGDGSQTRTFCYIDDNVDTAIAALKNPQTENQTMNIGNNTAITIKQLAELIIRISGSTSKIIYLPERKRGDMKRRLPDISKMRTVLDRDLIPLEEGLMRMIEARKGVRKEATVAQI